jgi:hypothetical protein
MRGRKRALIGIKENDRDAISASLYAVWVSFTLRIHFGISAFSIEKKALHWPLPDIPGLNPCSKSNKGHACIGIHLAWHNWQIGCTGIHGCQI